MGFKIYLIGLLVVFIFTVFFVVVLRPKTCSDFDTQKQARMYLGVLPKLDADHDLIPCEHLPKGGD